MVTLITDQLESRILDNPTHHRTSPNNLQTPETQSPGIREAAYGLMPESSYWQLCPPSKSSLQGVLSSSFPPNPAPLGPPGASLPEGDGSPLQEPSTSLAVQSLSAIPAPPLPPPPPPPPPKRHCRSLSVPEDLAHCRYTWKPSASKVWTPVKRRCQSSECGGGAACPARAPSASIESSLQSSSSPTFYSLALSPDSPLPWTFPWDPAEPVPGAGGGGCCCFFASPCSCSSSPSAFCAPPAAQRCFSLSPVRLLEAAARFLPPPPAPPPGASCPGVAAPHSPSSACSTPSLLRRATPPQHPRCHSQPCDMLLCKPGLKRRRDPETRPRARPELDFSKMTQTRSSDFSEEGRRSCGGDVCTGTEPFWGEYYGSLSPAEGLGRTSIGPLGESEEEEEEEDEEREGPKAGNEVGQQSVFERDCTELDLNLIEEN